MVSYDLSTRWVRLTLFVFLVILALCTAYTIFLCHSFNASTAI